MRQKSSRCFFPPASACLHTPDAKQRTAEPLHTAPGLLARAGECPGPWAEPCFSLGLQLCQAQCLKFSFSSAAFLCEQLGDLGLRGAAEQPGVQAAQPTVLLHGLGPKWAIIGPNSSWGVCVEVSCALFSGLLILCQARGGQWPFTEEMCLQGFVWWLQPSLGRGSFESKQTGNRELAVPGNFCSLTLCYSKLFGNSAM